MSSKKKKADAEAAQAQATVEVRADLDVEELEGIGRVTGAKLKERGYYTVRDIAFASAKELAEIIGNEERAQ
ncbi:MAG: helix-hairpin-helix domain-containing protein, partial [Pyrobaculum sp.]